MSAKETPNIQAVRQVETLKEQPRVGKCLITFCLRISPDWSPSSSGACFLLDVKLLQNPLFQMRQTERAVPRSRRLSESNDLLRGHQVLLPAAVTAQGARAIEGEGKKSAAGIGVGTERGTGNARGVPPVVGGVDPLGGGTPLVIGNEKERIGVGREPDGGAPVPPKATASPIAGVGPRRTRHGGVGGTGAPLVVPAQIGEARRDDSLQ